MNSAAPTGGNPVITEKQLYNPLIYTLAAAEVRVIIRLSETNPEWAAEKWHSFKGSFSLTEEVANRFISHVARTFSSPPCVWGGVGGGVCSPCDHTCPYRAAFDIAAKNYPEMHNLLYAIKQMVQRKGKG